VVHVVPLTSTIRGYQSEVTIEPDPANGLEAVSAVQCQHIRAIAVGRLAAPIGNVGPQALTQMREILADLLDL
jgi:mRNA interferase MazF